MRKLVLIRRGDVYAVSADLSGAASLHRGGGGRLLPAGNSDRGGVDCAGESSVATKGYSAAVTIHRRQSDRKRTRPIRYDARRRPQGQVVVFSHLDRNRYRGRLWSWCARGRGLNSNIVRPDWRLGRRAQGECSRYPIVPIEAQGRGREVTGCF